MGFKESVWSKLKDNIHFLFCAGLLWISYFATATNMGFSEDDVFHTGDGINNASLSYVWHNLVDSILTFPQGRPIGPWLNRAWPALAESLSHSIFGHYLLGFCILLATGFLLKSVFEKLSLSRSEQFIGLCFFFLWPSDTNRNLLHHLHSNYTSFLLFLWAMNLYLKNSRPWFVAPLTLSLLSYECFFPMMLAFPLANFCQKKSVYRSLKTHSIDLLLCTSILASTLALRVLIADSRILAVKLTPINLLSRLARCWIEGPLTSLTSLPLNFKLVHSSEVVAGAALGLISVIFYLSISRKEGSRPEDKSTGFLFALAIALCALSYSAYSISDRYPPVATIGRMASVHLGGLFGLSLFFALIPRTLFNMRSRTIKRTLIAFLLLPALAIGIAVGLRTQADRVLAWTVVRSQLATVLNAHPQLQAGELLMVQVDNPANTPHSFTRTWTDAIVFQRLFYNEWGDHWPRLQYYIVAELQNFKFSVTPDEFSWDKPADNRPAFREKVPRGKVFFSQIDENLTAQKYHLAVNLRERLTPFGRYYFE